MSRLAALLALPWMLGLVSCASRPTTPPVFAEPAPGVARIDSGSAGSRASASPALSPELLPSITLTVTVQTESPLLQRPVTGSAVLRPLPPGTVAERLGELSNAEGEWLSVAVEGLQGWVRASAVRR